MSQHTEALETYSASLGEKETIFRVKVRRGVLVCAHEPKQGFGAAIYLPEVHSEVGKAALKAFIILVKNRAKEELFNVEMKLVGEETAVGLLKVMFKKSNLDVIGEKCVTTTAECYFYCNNGRLRVRELRDDTVPEVQVSTLKKTPTIPTA